MLTCSAGVVVAADAALAVHAVADGAAIETDLPYRISGLLEPAHDHWVWRMCQGAEPTVPETFQGAGEQAPRGGAYGNIRPGPRGLAPERRLP